MANNRTRGNNYEREVVKALKAVGFEDAKTTRDASTYADSLKIDIIGCGSYVFQCKRKKKGYATSKTLFEIQHEEWAKHISKQASAGVSKDNLIESIFTPNLVPVLVSRPDQGESLATIRLSDLLDIISPVVGK